MTLVDTPTPAEALLDARMKFAHLDGRYLEAQHRVGLAKAMEQTAYDNREAAYREMRALEDAIEDKS